MNKSECVEKVTQFLSSNVINHQESFWEKSAELFSCFIECNLEQRKKTFTAFTNSLELLSARISAARHRAGLKIRSSSFGKLVWAASRLHVKCLFKSVKVIRINVMKQFAERIQIKSTFLFPCRPRGPPPSWSLLKVIQEVLAGSKNSTCCNNYETIHEGLLPLREWLTSRLRITWKLSQVDDIWKE